MRKAIIVDIDGTLAKMHDRGPFEWSKVGQDKVNTPIKDLVNNYHDLGYTVLIFSGRDASCFELTTEWLFDNDNLYDALYMRPEKNQEKDSIIKRRIFDEVVKDKYIVEFVLDDRDQVVELWRKELGLTCLQVDYGNF